MRHVTSALALSLLWLPAAGAFQPVSDIGLDDPNGCTAMSKDLSARQKQLNEEQAQLDKARDELRARSDALDASRQAIERDNAKLASDTAAYNAAVMELKAQQAQGKASTGNDAALKEQEAANEQRQQQLLDAKKALADEVRSHDAAQAAAQEQVARINAQIKSFNEKSGAFQKDATRYRTNCSHISTGR